MDFNGKNNLNSTALLMFERAKYKKYMNDNPNLTIKDFNLGEFVQYGRIDTSMNIVYNNGLSLKQISQTDSGETHFAIDFVSDSFTAIKKKMSEAILKGAVPKNDPYFSDLKVSEAFQNPIYVYTNYISRMLENYNNIFLNNYKIENFDQYYNYFLNYATTMGVNYPMTFSGFQRSKHSNIFTTGLAVSITNFAFDDDKSKQKFIESPVFEFFKSVCLNNGMVLMENAPWIMVADIISPSLSIYTKNYNLSSKNSIFLKYFNYCIEKDIELLFNNLLTYFRIYLSNNNTYRNIFKICKDNKITIEKRYLEPANNNTINQKYSNSYMYDLLIKLKNIEEYDYFPEFKIKEIIHKAKFLEKTFDNSEAIGYIRKEFRKIHKFRHGGLNYLNEKALKRRNNDFSDT